jgi:hypothetical protein
MNDNETKLKPNEKQGLLEKEQTAVNTFDDDGNGAGGENQRARNADSAAAARGPSVTRPLMLVILFATISGFLFGYDRYWHLMMIFCFV